MISTKPLLMNVSSSIRDNLDFDSNGTEESNSHFEKQFAAKNSTELGMVINVRNVFRTAADSIPSNFDIFSITTDLMD
jgi:hypothetical protein